MGGRSVFVAGVLAAVMGTALAWELPADKGTMPKETVAAIVAGNDYPETSGYKQSIDYIDFTANGHKFTQVVVTLTPDKPLLRNGKRVAVVGAEPGSEYAMDFVSTVEGKDGPGAWLARRGITFVALTRVGRWNFLAPTGDGSWETVPLGQRMPIFNRDQKAHWPESQYSVVHPPRRDSGSASSSVFREPREGSELQKYMIATTGNVFVEGYRRALEKAITDRSNALVLFWGWSTGGPSIYTLSKYYLPDCYLGWGMSTTALASASRNARAGKFNGLYERSALRVRERGFDDFEFYTRNIDAETKARWWKASQRDPRFKGTEDAPMNLQASALTEHALRLWTSDFLPDEVRRRGLPALLLSMFEPSFPPEALKQVPLLEVNGTLDETVTPADVDGNRVTMEGYVKKHRVGRIEGLHHYLYTQDDVKVVGTTWLRYIESGYFDAGR
jgi:hypothetical protein